MGQGVHLAVYHFSSIHPIILIIKIGEKVRTNAIIQSLFPARVPPLRHIPSNDIAKLKIIKGTMKKINTKPQPLPEALKLGMKLLVMLSASNIEIIEQPPRDTEALSFLDKYLFLFSFTSAGSHHSLIT